MLCPVLGVFLHTLDPYAIGPIRWYGLSYLMGFLVGYGLVRRVTRVGVSTLTPQQVGDFVVWLAMGIVIGGRLGYVLFYRIELLWTFSDSLPYWNLLAINQGGMASHGGILGAVLAGWLYTVRRGGHRWLHLLDLIAFGAPMGLFFGRVANFINGELIGRACAPGLPWAVKFPQEMYEWGYPQLNRLQQSIDAAGAFPGVQRHPIGVHLPQIIEKLQAGSQPLADLIGPMLTPRHPSQLYQALLEGLLLFFILAWVWAKPRQPGVVAGIASLSYAVLRIIGECFRQPDAHIGFQWLGLTRGQLLSVGLLAVGVACLVAAYRSGSQPMGGWVTRRSRAAG